jgi:hypothetical protein
MRNTSPVWIQDKLHLEMKLEAARRGITMGELVAVLWITVNQTSKKKTKQ